MHSRWLVLRIAVLALPAFACSKPGLPTLATKEVDVTVTCVGNAVSATISPYAIELVKNSQGGESVEWRLLNSPNASEIEIDKKRGKDFPYEVSLPVKGNANKPPKAGGMKRDAEGSYPYNISVTCTPDGGTARKIVIDPDMIIRR
jgi:hypothetical protein